MRFEIDAEELLRRSSEIEDAGWELGAIYHSHMRSAPYPSQTDINFARRAGRALEWIIVGLAGGRAGGALLPDRGRRRPGGRAERAT